MRNLILILTFLPTLCLSQMNEFPLYNNGLIYSPETMTRLKYIVDSLNLKFRQCEPRRYQSLEQGIATFVDLKSAKVRKHIQHGLTYDQLIKSYPRHVKEKNVWIVKHKYNDYNGMPVIEYEKPGNQTESVIVSDDPSNDKTSGWIIGEDNAVYIHGLKTTELAGEYGSLVMYADCLIDTTATIFTVADADFPSYKSPGPVLTKFMEEVNNFPGRPELPDVDTDNQETWDSICAIYIPRKKMWDSLRMQRLDYRMKDDPSLMKLLLEAKAEALHDTTSNTSLELYIERYLSKEEALAMKRSRKVRGSCSMDLGPRNHARDICRLSAETAKWDIFLRSHLDIMNDRFERMSDGSWAWEGRKTYIRELEELDIQVVDLLLGTCLRVNPAAKNHYWGSVARIGRALAEANDKNGLEQKLQKMIRDEALDPYNRLLMAYLYAHYTFNLDQDERRKSNKKELNAAVTTLPLAARKIWHE